MAEMNTKRLVLWTVLSLFGIAIVLVAVVAAGVGGDASNLNGYLHDAVSKHASLDEVKQKLTSTGVNLDANPAPAQLTGTGPHHSALLYSTWLTVRVGFDNDQKAHEFEINRASSWF